MFEKLLLDASIYNNKMGPALAATFHAIFTPNGIPLLRSSAIRMYEFRKKNEPFPIGKG
jgi:hypothetical protein